MHPMYSRERNNPSSIWNKHTYEESAEDKKEMSVFLFDRIINAFKYRILHIIRISLNSIEAIIKNPTQERYDGMI